MKKLTIIPILLVISILFCCCAANDTETIKDNPLFQDIATQITSMKIVVTILDSVVYETDDPDVITSVMQTFNGWDPEENNTGICDQTAVYQITFNDKLEIKWGPTGTYGLIKQEDGYEGYTFPVAFGERILELIGVRIKID